MPTTVVVVVVVRPLLAVQPGQAEITLVQPAPLSPEDSGLMVAAQQLVPTVAVVSAVLQTVVTAVLQT